MEDGGEPLEESSEMSVAEKGRTVVVVERSEPGDKEIKEVEQNGSGRS